MIYATFLLRQNYPSCLGQRDAGRGADGQASSDGRKKVLLRWSETTREAWIRRGIPFHSFVRTPLHASQPAIAPAGGPFLRAPAPTLTVTPAPFSSASEVHKKNE